MSCSLLSPSVSQIQMLGQAHPCCSACSTAGIWFSDWAGLQALHFGCRASWRRRRKISSLKHGCPSQGTALAARCEGCPLPIFFLFLCFPLVSSTAILLFFIFLFSDPFWEGSRRRNKKWLMKYRGGRLHMQIHRVPPRFPPTWASAPNQPTELSCPHFISEGLVHRVTSCSPV